MMNDRCVLFSSNIKNHSNYSFKNCVFLKTEKPMNKLLLPIILLISISASMCKKTEVVADDCKFQNAVNDLPWLLDKTASFSKIAGMLGCPGNHIQIVKSATYNSKTVFIINSGICGQAPTTNTEIYNCDGSIICKDLASCQTKVNSLTNVKQIYSFGQ
jgi:hypothetical protein